MALCSCWKLLWAVPKHWALTVPRALSPLWSFTILATLGTESKLNIDSNMQSTVAIGLTLLHSFSILVMSVLWTLGVSRRVPNGFQCVQYFFTALGLSISITFVIFASCEGSLWVLLKLDSSLTLRGKVCQRPTDRHGVSSHQNAGRHCISYIILSTA